MTLQEIITQFGYPALFLGTLFEGETIVIIAGFLAHSGYLDLKWVMIVSFLGTFIMDQSMFLFGSFRGPVFLSRHPKWIHRAAKVKRLIERYKNTVIFSFRFVYGLRIITPFVIGMSGFSRKRFLLLNILSVTLWVGVIAGGGYLLGEVLGRFFANIRKYELIVVGALVVMGGITFVIYYFRNRKPQ